MDYSECIYIFARLSLAGWVMDVWTTKYEIKDIGIHEKYYPKHYIMPSRRMRKIFNLKKREIPKWTYIELHMSFVYIGLFIISSLVVLLLKGNAKISAGYIFFMIYVAILFSDMIHHVIYIFLYNVGKRPKKKIMQEHPRKSAWRYL